MIGSDDEATFEYLRGREFAPQGDDFDAAVKRWRELPTEEGAKFDKSLTFNAADIAPQVTWGTNPASGDSRQRGHPRPDASFTNDNDRKSAEQALKYMDLIPGTPITDVPVERVFIGSCTNARMEDLRAAAKVAAGYKVPSSVNAMVVPGSGQIKKPGRSRRPGQGVPGGRVRMARGGLQHVPGNEPRHARPGSALRIDQQSQLRRSTGQGRTHASRIARHGRRRRGEWTVRRHPWVGIQIASHLRRKQ